MLVHNFPLENVAINCRANKTRRCPTVPTTYIAQWALQKPPKPPLPLKKPPAICGPIKVYKTKPKHVNQKKKKENSFKMPKQNHQRRKQFGQLKEKRRWNLKPLPRFALESLFECGKLHENRKCNLAVVCFSFTFFMIVPIKCWYLLDPLKYVVTSTPM